MNVISLRWAAVYSGPVRWHIAYNLSVLRLISFGMDMHWALNNTQDDKRMGALEHGSDSHPNAAVKVESRVSVFHSAFFFREGVRLLWTFLSTVW